jgi:hypothetical protein
MALIDGHPRLTPAGARVLSPAEDVAVSRVAGRIVVRQRIEGPVRAQEEPMPTTQWSHPARALVDQCPPTMAGPWSATFTAQHVALTLAISSSVLPTVDFTEIAMDLGDGVEALEMARPWLIRARREARTDQSDHRLRRTRELAALIVACVELAAATLGNRDESLTPGEVLAVSRCDGLLSDEHDAPPGGCRDRAGHLRPTRRRGRAVPGPRAGHGHPEPPTGRARPCRHRRRVRRPLGRARAPRARPPPPRPTSTTGTQ